MIVNNIAVPVNTVTDGSCMSVKLDKNAKPFPFMIIGRGSYIVEASVQSMINFNVEAGVHNLQIGQFCSLATNITFMLDMNHDYKGVSTGSSSLFGPPSKHVPNIPRKGQIILQNDVWLGHGTTVMSGVTIRNGAVIAANSHVVKDVPPYAIVGGNPARIIKFRFTDEQIADLLNISWWDWDNEQITSHQKDFKAPIDEFISKHRKPKPLTLEKEKDRQSVYLFFADFTEPYPIWEKVIRAYSGQFRQDPGKQLLVYLPDDQNANFCRERLSSFILRDGNIAVQVGQINGEAELFARADCYITSRAMQTVQRSCLADKFSVKILSGVDEPLFN